MSAPTIFKRATVDDPLGRAWAIVVEDRLDPKLARIARDTAERFGRYAMTIVGPDGRDVVVLRDANSIQVDRELERFRAAIAAGDWSGELAALAGSPTPPDQASA